MNISSVISSTFNSSATTTAFETSSVVYVICILISFPTNFYAIWLIVMGTGNGLAAEFFILNLSVCDIILCTETLLILSYKSRGYNLALGFLDGVYMTGHPLFECLICVERYLAVVHPVIFLKFKPLRYRLMCSAVVWITTFVSGVVSVVIWLFCWSLYYIVWMVSLFFFISIQLFCCLAVLRALKQSGPGERGREREEENHMKRRAFHLILISTATTVFIYATIFILMFFPTAYNGNKIIMFLGQMFFSLVGLVQPILFLYRVGKLKFFAC